MLLSDYMYDYYAESAQTLTILLLVVILAVSFLLSYVVKRRNGLDDSRRKPDEPIE